MKKIIALIAVLCLVTLSSCALDPTDREPDEEPGVEFPSVAPQAMDFSGTLSSADIILLNNIPYDSKFVVFLRPGALVNKPLYQKVYNLLVTNWLDATDVNDFTNIGTNLGVSFGDTTGEYFRSIVIAGDAAEIQEADMVDDISYTNSDSGCMDIFENDPRYAAVDAQAVMNDLWRQTDWDYASNEWRDGTNFYYYWDGYVSIDRERYNYHIHNIYYYGDGYVGYDKERQLPGTNFRTEGSVYGAASGTFDPNMGLLLNDMDFLTGPTYNGVTLYQDMGDPTSMNLALPNTSTIFLGMNQSSIEKIIDNSGTSILSRGDMSGLLTQYANAIMFGGFVLSLEQVMRTAYWSEIPTELQTEVDKYEAVWGFGAGLDTGLEVQSIMLIREVANPDVNVFSLSMEVYIDVSTVVDYINMFIDDNAFGKFVDNPFTGDPIY